MNIPHDPFILLSFINTKLRDEYHNLDDLCMGLNIERSQLEATLSSIKFSYTKDLNRFTSIM
ncbi:MAG: DUF4250 domain-containing protein [Herbinix sp.]|nr:DUF4250 domain-containing protein [Herbinix sp.]